MSPKEGPLQGRPERHEHQRQPNREREPSPYHQAARFIGQQSEIQSGQVYFQTQEAIYEDEMCDLSAYRLKLNRIWHVAVIGEQPSTETGQTIETILANGELTTLPPEALKFLDARRTDTIRQGSWVEKHHRPGKRFDL